MEGERRLNNLLDERNGRHSIGPEQRRRERREGNDEGDGHGWFSPLQPQRTESGRQRSCHRAIGLQADADAGDRQTDRRSPAAIAGEVHHG